MSSDDLIGIMRLYCPNNNEQNVKITIDNLVSEEMTLNFKDLSIRLGLHKDSYNYIRAFKHQAFLRMISQKTPIRRLKEKR